MKVLKTAITTVARYETTHPPRGEVLLRLAEIARQQRRYDLADIFRFSYLEEVLENVGRQLTTVSVRIAHSFIHVLEALRSTNPAFKEIAARAFLSITEASMQIGVIEDAAFFSFSPDRDESEEKSK